MIGETEDDVAAAISKGVGHLLGFGRLDRIPVVLQIVNAPGRPLPRVIFGKVIFANGPGQNLFVDDIPFVLRRLHP